MKTITIQLSVEDAKMFEGIKNEELVTFLKRGKYDVEYRRNRNKKVAAELKEFKAFQAAKKV